MPTTMASIPLVSQLTSYIGESSARPIQEIKIHGLYEVKENMMLSLLNIQKGTIPTKEEIQQQINTYYATGLFKKVEIYHRGDRLKIIVYEWEEERVLAEASQDAALYYVVM